MRVRVAYMRLPDLFLAMAVEREEVESLSGGSEWEG